MAFAGIAMHIERTDRAVRSDMPRAVTIEQRADGRWTGMTITLPHGAKPEAVDAVVAAINAAIDSARAAYPETEFIP